MRGRLDRHGPAGSFRPLPKARQSHAAGRPRGLLVEAAAVVPHLYPQPGPGALRGHLDMLGPGVTPGVVQGLAEEERQVPFSLRRQRKVCRGRIGQAHLEACPGVLEERAADLLEMLEQIRHAASPRIEEPEELACPAGQVLR